MIGERIKQARKIKRMSMEALANRVGISRMAISKYERGLNTPGSAVLLKLAGALDVSIEFLMRPPVVQIQIQASRKHSRLSKKDHSAIQMQIQEWVERYLETESLFGPDSSQNQLPEFSVSTVQEIEAAARKLREEWLLGIDPIENVMGLLEDQGIKIWQLEGFEKYDACTFKANGHYVIVVSADKPGDRQRFDLCHELGHLVLNLQKGLDEEKAAHRFAAAFLVPKDSVYKELGVKRSNLNFRELYLLKHKYGFSMQAWIYRAKDLEIITAATLKRLFRHLNANNWRKLEPGDPVPAEHPRRMQQLIYRALAEDMISRSRAEELWGAPIPLELFEESRA